MYCNKMPNTGMSNRYSGVNGLSDANYNDQKYSFVFPTDLGSALEAANRFLNASSTGLVGSFTAQVPQYPMVYDVKGKLYAVTQYADAVPQLARRTFGPGQGIILTPSAMQKGIEFVTVGELVAKTTGVTPKTPDEDCPPPDNCTEKWVDKTLYVSAKPTKDAIEIPVAFKKLVCEGESTEDPQVDCEELLKALQQSVNEGQVPGMVNGLGAVPANYPPDWCKDCEEKLVKASAYVTDYAATGSKPFKVKVKVLVCETSAEPKIDCEEVVKALVTGMRAKKKKTLSGLSEAKTQASSSNAASGDESSSGNEFDKEAGTINPNGESNTVKQQAGFPWWMWLILGGTALYAARKL
jgi:hypothetical protein